MTTHLPVLFLLIVVVGLVATGMRMAAKTRRQRVVDEEQLAFLRCPTCQHTGDVQRVRLGQRLASGILGGLIFSRKARAQFECRRCRYLW